jgi:glycerate dehydrogenase
MKIVVLDGYLVNPGDLSWEGLKKLGDLTVYDHTPSELTLERCKDAEIVISNKVILHKNEIEKLKVLKYIGVTATGL